MEEFMDAEVGDNWDTAIAAGGKSSGGGIRHALRFGLIDKQGKITPAGKKFFDSVSGMYNDARNLINDKMDRYQIYREQRGYKRNPNPIGDDHRLSAAALLGLITTYNQVVGSDSAGRLEVAYNIPIGIHGEAFLNNDDVTPIEGVISPNPNDMPMDSVNQGHVIDAIVSGNERNSAGKPHWENIQGINQDSKIQEQHLGKQSKP